MSARDVKPFLSGLLPFAVLMLCLCTVLLWMQRQH